MQRIIALGPILLLGVLSCTLSTALAAQDKTGPAPSAAATPAAPVAEAQHDPHLHADMTVPKTAQLLSGYGDGGFAISHANPAAAKFFANGLELHAAFAHLAAQAAMNEAARLDPACAMCRWGQALTGGPTINYGKDAKEREPLLALAQAAKAGAAKNGTAKERALTTALVTRYTPAKDEAIQDRAYAAAMQQVAAQFPQDDQIAVLTADALMVAAFTEDGEYDHPLLAQSLKLLETVLARTPEYTPAIHFYIHATEVVGTPELAVPYAEQLERLAPRASHLVHMPSHTWYWVGRYHDAAEANRRAVEIDKANAKRLGLGPPQGVWGLPYHSHNVVYGLGGALMAGDSRIALDLARPLVEMAAQRDKAEPATQLLAASGYFALARFDPASVMALPEPKLPYLQAARHYARAESLVWAGDLAGAKYEREAIPSAIAQGKAADWPHDGTSAAEQMLGITRAVIEGRIAMAERRWSDAAIAFRQGAGFEETKEFAYFNDPPAFWYPVRRDLAAALLAAGDAAGAQREAEASLRLRRLDPVAEQILSTARTLLGKGSPLLR
jgi:hypothetical protein